MILFISLAACKEGHIPETEMRELEQDERFLPLDELRLLRRISLDTRGILPSEEELQQVEADPGQLEELTAAYLQTEEHEDRLAGLFSEWFLTRLDKFNLDGEDYGLDPEQAYAFSLAVGEEPLPLPTRPRRTSLASFSGRRELT